MINKVYLIGNLGRDPEVRHLEGGSAVAKFPVATNESYRDKSGEWQKITEWHDVVVWRALAERLDSHTVHDWSQAFLDDLKGAVPLGALAARPGTPSWARPL